MATVLFLRKIRAILTGDANSTWGYSVVNKLSERGFMKRFYYALSSGFITSLIFIFVMLALFLTARIFIISPLLGLLFAGLSVFIFVFIYEIIDSKEVKWGEHWVMKRIFWLYYAAMTASLLYWYFASSFYLNKNQKMQYVLFLACQQISETANIPLSSEFYV